MRVGREALRVVSIVWILVGVGEIDFIIRDDFVRKLCFIFGILYFFLEDYLSY